MTRREKNSPWRRWVAEWMFVWMLRYIRLPKDSKNSLESSLAWVDGLCATSLTCRTGFSPTGGKKAYLPNFLDWIPMDSRHPAHSLATCRFNCDLVTELRPGKM